MSDFEVAMAAEDLLREHRAFLNGLDQTRTGDMFAYMTVLDYPAVARTVSEHPEIDWEAAIRMWEQWYYLSPIPKLLVSEIRRQLHASRHLRPRAGA